MTNGLKRLLSLLCIISLLVASLSIPSVARAESPSPQVVAEVAESVVQWGKSLFGQTQAITQTVVVQEEVVLIDGAALSVQGGRLIIAPGAVVIGDITVPGDGSVLEIEGTVRGNIHITGTDVRIVINGMVQGAMTIDGLHHTTGDDKGVTVEISREATVDTLVLAGAGQVECRGRIGLVDADPANRMSLIVAGGTVETLYARSDAVYSFFEGARAGSIHLDGLKCTYEKQGYVTNVGLFDRSHADMVIVDAGYLGIYNGCTVDTLFLYGNAVAHIDQGRLREGETWPAGDRALPPHIGNITQIGEKTHCMNRAHIGQYYVEGGTVTNIGFIETLVGVNATIHNVYGGYFGNEQERASYADMFDALFEKHYGTLVATGSRVNVNAGSIIDTAIISGGRLEAFHADTQTLVLDATAQRIDGHVASDALIGTLVTVGRQAPEVRAERIERGMLESGEVIGDPPTSAVADRPKETVRGGADEAGATSLKEGAYWVNGVAGNQWFSVASDAYMVLNISVAAHQGYGLALIRTPEGAYHLLNATDGEQQLSLLNETAGDYSIRLIGAAGLAGFALSVRTDAPLHIDYTLTERAAAPEGADADRVPGDIDNYHVGIFNGTKGQALEDFTAKQGVLYAMPDAVSPGDTLALSLRKHDGSIMPFSVSVTLDDRRFASVALEGTARGRYIASPPDSYHAHLYLYDANGNYLREVFPQGSVYDTGALDAGEYHAVWIRAGAGGWKLLRLEDFAENGLLDETHYRLDSFVLSDGLIVDAGTVEIPEEPVLQSAWLDGTRTRYQARVGSIVENGMAMLSLEWALSAEDMQDVTAEVTFLPGTVYVDGSAAIDGEGVDAIRMDQTLRVPLGDRAEGRLLFYIEGEPGADALISNASIRFESQGREVSQYVGAAQVSILPLSIHGPSLTSESTVTLYGYTAPHMLTYLYDNGMQAGATMSDANGLWSARIALSGEQVHAVTAGSSEDGVLSAPVEIRRAMGAPVLDQFALHYIEHGVTRKISIEGEMFGALPVKFAYEPGTDLTFVLGIGNDAYVETVTVVAEMNGQREVIPATRDARSGDWVAVGQFTKDQMFAPDWFAIEYTIQEDVLALALQEPFAAVPLISSLHTATDMDGAIPLERYYMASPTLQREDHGFGPGWQTSYSIRAVTYEATGSHWLGIVSPAGTRVFRGEGGGYAEVYGYATAVISSKNIITVTEATGATMTFDQAGRLTASTDAYRQKTTLTYDDQGRLSMLSCVDDSLVFAYGESGLIESAAAGDRTVSYRYTNGHLTSAVGVGGHESYTYEGLMIAGGQHPLTCVNSDAGGMLLIRYDDAGFPAQVELDGNITDFAYAEDAVTLRTDGSAMVFRLNEHGQCTRVE